MNRPELANFLRGRRARIQPADVGLETGQRRRTPGLRREEVARLAAMSVDYYTRLEQARGPHPSRELLSGLARALRLSDTERAHLFHLAGQTPGPAAGPPSQVRSGVRYLLDRLDDTPAFVLNARYDVLAWNPLAAALIVDFSAWPARERNMVKMVFGLVRRPGRPDPAAEGRYNPAQTRAFAAEVVGELRAAAARYPDDPGIHELVAELLAASPEFTELWARHDVAVRRSISKTMYHPTVGTLELDCETLLIPESDQRLVLYTAAPGSPSFEALRLLRVLGTQSLQPSG